MLRAGGEDEAETVRRRSGECVVCVTWCSIPSRRINCRFTFLATFPGSFFTEDLVDVIDSSSACVVDFFEKENLRIAKRFVGGESEDRRLRKREARSDKGASFIQ